MIQSEKEAQLRIKALMDEIDAYGQQLMSEQDDSEAEHEAWENEAEEDQGDEPDVVDHSETIDRLEAAVEYLDKAQGALNAD